MVRIIEASKVSTVLLDETHRKALIGDFGRFERLACDTEAFVSWPLSLEIEWGESHRGLEGLECLPGRNSSQSFGGGDLWGCL